jgi:type IV pilus assembly protein PilV
MCHVRHPNTNKKNNKRMRIRTTKQKGVTFLEVLVAVVVLSIGFLATSRMQIMGMRYNQSAFFKSQASIMAADIADRMRANIAGVQGGEYDAISTASLPNDPGCMQVGCNFTELAQLDLRQWGLTLNDTLPEGLGTVTRSGTLFEIEVSWNENMADDNEAQSVKIWLNP